MSPWKGNNIECWQEYKYTIQGWYKANMNFMTPGQSLDMLVGVFRDAKEQADAVNSYLFASMIINIHCLTLFLGILTLYSA